MRKAKNSNLHDTIITALATNKEKYQNNKVEISNDVKMLEYLFNKRTLIVKKVGNLLAIYNSMNNSNIRVVRLRAIDFKHIEDCFVIGNDFEERFDTYYKEAKKSGITNNILMKLFNDLPVKSLLSENVLKIINILDNIKKYYVKFFYDWSFVQKFEQVQRYQRRKINYLQPFVYDIYGITIYRTQLQQFVILYDDYTHFDSQSEYYADIHINDIYKQFILFQMNIHLLRLNKKSNFRKEIFSFLKKITGTTKYIIVNPIEPNVKIFKSLNNCELDIENFSHHYSNNHNIYLKKPDIDPSEYDHNYDQYFYELMYGKNYLENKPADQEFKVSNNVLEQILAVKKATPIHIPEQKSKGKYSIYVNGELVDLTSDQIECV